MISIGGADAVIATRPQMVGSVKDSAPAGLRLLQAVSPNFTAGTEPNHTQAAVAKHFHGISAADSDKDYRTITVDGSGNVTGYDFSAGNALRAAKPAGLGYDRWHTIAWHSANPTPFNVTSANWQTILANYASALASGATLWSSLKSIDVANEIFDNGESDYMRRSLWYTAAAADGTWTLGTDLWWLKAFSVIKGAADASTKLILNDFSCAEQTSAWGYGTNPSDFGTTAYQAQKWERMRYSVQQGLAAIAAGYDARLDGLGFQSHLDAARVYTPDDLKYKLWECNLLELPVSITELNLKTSGVAAIGLTVDSPTANDYAKRFVARYVHDHMRYSANFRELQCWTAATDDGVDSAMQALSAGQPTPLLDGIQWAFQNPPTPAAKRVGRTLFGKSGGWAPYDLIGTPGSTNVVGMAGAVALPWSHYKRRVSGVLQNMATQNWEMQALVIRAGSNAAMSGLSPIRLVDASSNALIACTFDASGNLQLATSAGTVTIAASTASNEYLNIGLKYNGTTLKATVSKYLSGTATNASSVTSQTVTIADPAQIQFWVGYTSGSMKVTQHVIYDTTDISASDAEFMARTYLTTALGSPATLAEMQAWVPGA